MIYENNYIIQVFYILHNCVVNIKLSTILVICHFLFIKKKIVAEQV